MTRFHLRAWWRVVAGAALLKHVAASRELRDRYLEQFNSGLVLANGKYEVSRMIATAAKVTPEQKMLAA